MKKIITVAFFILAFGNLVKFWYINSGRFTRQFDPDYFSRLYSQSQYVLGQKSEGGIFSYLTKAKLIYLSQPVFFCRCFCHPFFSVFTDT